MANIIKHAAGLTAVSAKDPLRVFGNFLFRTWKTLNFPVPTRIAYDVAEFMDDRDTLLKIIMGFRGMAKSYITVTKGLHELYVDPEEAMVLTTSATTRAAAQNSYFAWQMLQTFEWLEHLRPSSDQRQSTNSFDVRGASPKKSESFASMSLFGQITGRRATLSIPDDIEVPQTSDTEKARSDLRRAHSEIPGAVLIPGGREIILGTAQNEQSIYVELATEKGYAMRMWPSVYPLPDEMVKFGSWLSPMLSGDLLKDPGLAGMPTEPSRFPIEVLAEKEILFGRTEYARQFKLHLDAGASNNCPLKLRDIPIIEIAPPSLRSDGSRAVLVPPEVRWGPSKGNRIEDIKVDCLTGDALHEPAYVSPAQEWRPANLTWMYVDPSGKGMDESCWPVGADLGGLIFLCDLEASIEGHTDSTLRRIAMNAKKWNAQYIYVESNFGQGMFSSLLRPHLIEVGHAAVIEDDRKGGVRKEQRIVATLEPTLTAHRLIANAEIFRKDFSSAGSYDQVEEARRRFYRFSYQLTRQTTTKDCLAHDDKGDSVASLVAKAVERVRQRTQDALAMDKEAAFNEEIRKMILERRKQGLPTYGAERMPGMDIGLGDPLQAFGRRRGKQGSNFR